jgi:hypothetical protein
MASKIEICNLALSEIGSDTIVSLDDNAKEARLCRLYFDRTRDRLLRSHDWNFARKRQDLALLSDTYSKWTYAYAYPSDCICVREIYNGNAESSYANGLYNRDASRFRATLKVEYEIATDSDKDQKLILTDYPEAELIYTSRVTNPTLWDEGFVDAMVYLLAARLAVPLHDDKTLQLRLVQQAAAAVRAAQADNANEEHTPPDDDGDFVRARRG